MVAKGKWFNNFMWKDSEKNGNERKSMRQSLHSAFHSTIQSSSLSQVCFVLSEADLTA